MPEREIERGRGWWWCRGLCDEGSEVGAGVGRIASGLESKGRMGGRYILSSGVLGRRKVEVVVRYGLGTEAPNVGR